MINILEYINPFSFFIALCFGIFLVYVSTPPTIVYKYPTPDNAGKLVYKDESDTCYQYKAEEVNCSDYKGNIEETKIQHDKEDKEQKEDSFFTKLKNKLTGN